MSSILSALIKRLRFAADFNPDVQVAPRCILWTDYERQWESIIERLQDEIPELLVLGDYEPEKRTGPAIWLRCVIAQEVEGISFSDGSTPILYLPGVSRQDLREVENCPAFLKPLVFLQYLGVIWSQVNGKDWTILAFLKSRQGGLGLDVARDRATLNAMQLSLSRFLDEDVEFLRGKHLDKDYFNTLLTSGDLVRDLLQWLDQGEAFRKTHESNEWRAFVEVCQSWFDFHPEDDGILTGVAKLASHEGAWKAVWERFCEAPKRYPNIPAQIRSCQPPIETIFWFTAKEKYEGWPQWNENKEDTLRQALLELKKHPPHEARREIEELAKQHSARKDLVWAELGEAPLACAIEDLKVLAEITSKSLSAGTIEDLVNGYIHSGWKADNAVLQILAHVKRQEDLEAVTTAIRSIYLPWVEESARYLQSIVEQKGYPFQKATSLQKLSLDKTGECLLFVDGLRFDIARRLKALLLKAGFHVEEKSKWVALPSITATGKPAVSPLAHLFQGKWATTDFEPSIIETGQSLKGGYYLKKLLKDSGWSVLDKAEVGDGKGRAWCEFGDIDHEGHERGWKLAKYLEEILIEIKDRVESLISAGWSSIRIVTDHGWLLMPGGLPKIDLPSSLTENKWGRCAVIKDGAKTDEHLFPWFWNSEQYFAIANGISCYRKGEEYAHGGLSLQECLTLELTVSAGHNGQLFARNIEITDISWKGLRCKVAIEGNVSSLKLDIRKQAGNSSTSIVMNVKPIKDNGISSVVVEDEELEGTDAVVVLLDVAGKPIAQRTTVVGGDDK